METIHQMKNHDDAMEFICQLDVDGYFIERMTMTGPLFLCTLTKGAEKIKIVSAEV